MDRRTWIHGGEIVWAALMMLTILTWEAMMPRRAYRVDLEVVSGSL